MTAFSDRLPMRWALIRSWSGAYSIGAMVSGCSWDDVSPYVELGSGANLLGNWLSDAKKASFLHLEYGGS